MMPGVVESYVFLLGSAKSDRGGISLSGFESRGVGLHFDTNGALVGGMDIATETGADTLARTVHFVRDATGQQRGSVSTVSHSAQVAYLRDSVNHPLGPPKREALSTEHLASIDSLVRAFRNGRCPGRVREANP